MGHKIQQLRRRGVIRVGAAYLAVVWLLLQVMDVLQDILQMPDWLVRYTFFALVLGFPVALILAWAYDVVPEGVKPTSEADETVGAISFGGRVTNMIIIGALSLVVVVLVFDNYVLGPRQELKSDTIPMISAYRQLTKSPILFPPHPSHIPIVADKSRLYFSDWEKASLGLRQMSRAGGEAIRIESPLNDGSFLLPLSMTPDGSRLLIAAHNPWSETQPSLWLLPVVGGPPQRLGDGGIAAYSLDGEQLVYSGGRNGADIYLARANHTGSKLLATSQGTVHWLAMSPDNREIRFYLPSHDGIDTIWTLSADGSDLRPLLPEWEMISHCCGSWTPDGRYFVFQATVGNRTHLWALRENGNSATEGPVTPEQISTGALNFLRPTLAEGGRKIFAIGWLLRGELVRWDSESGLFAPLPGLESLSAELLTHSRDEQWLAYVSYPESELWRSTSDGKQRLQLTQEPMRISRVEWSPDGETIAFEASLPGQPQRIYLVSMRGGGPRAINEGTQWQWSPTWSADGKFLAFSEAGNAEIQIFDVDSETVSGLEGTEGMRSPRWSPDGRYLAVRTRDSISLFNPDTQRTEPLIEKLHIKAFYWGKHSRFVYYHEPLDRHPDSWVHRIDVYDKTVEPVANIGGFDATYGSDGIWLGIAPDGAPLLLRDLSIHHIYRLDWLPD